MSDNTKAIIKTFIAAVLFFGSYAAVWTHKFGYWSF